MPEADDGFVELTPENTKAAPISPVTVGTFALRGGAERLSFSFSESMFGQLEGWPRVRADWNASTFTLRLKADERGAFEAARTAKGQRIVLRIPLPKGLVARPKLKEPCPHRVDGSTLYLTVPPPFGWRSGRRRLPLRRSLRQRQSEARSRSPAPPSLHPHSRRVSPENDRSACHAAAGSQRCHLGLRALSLSPRPSLSQ